MSAVAMLNRDTSVDSEVALQALVDNVSRSGSGVTVGWECCETIDDMLPNTLHVAPSATEETGNTPFTPANPSPAYVSVVTGSVTSVDTQDGWVEAGFQNVELMGHLERTDFDDQGAHWRTLRVTVTVDEVIAGKEGPTVVFDWPVMGNSQGGEDAEAIAQGIRDLGSILLFLDVEPEGDRLLRVSDRIHGVVQIGDDGALHLPFVVGDHHVSAADAEAAFLGRFDTLAELTEEAQQPDRVDDA